MIDTDGLTVKDDVFEMLWNNRFDALIFKKYGIIKTTQTLKDDYKRLQLKYSLLKLYNLQLNNPPDLHDFFEKIGDVINAV